MLPLFCLSVAAAAEKHSLRFFFSYSCYTGILFIGIALEREAHDAPRPMHVRQSKPNYKLHFLSRTLLDR
jgi:hypothetical protein